MSPDPTPTRRVQPVPGGHAGASVVALLDTARKFAEHVSEPESAAMAMSALEQAFALDPADRSGEISALLG
ncbi:MAG TPA: hypothetical protein VH439_04405, partial [Gemmatimonadales bacterium]